MANGTKKKINFEERGVSAFGMIDVGRKRPTRRYAVATGAIHLGAEAFAMLRDKALPKGDALSLSEIAGILAAKNTANVLPMCHPLPLEQVALNHFLDHRACTVHIYAEVLTTAKTGVEMEALNAVQAALLTIWDLAKGIDPDLRIEDIRLLAKTGGKTGIWRSPQGIPAWVEKALPSSTPMQGKTAVLLVMSDRASVGTYEDRTGPLLFKHLKDAGAKILQRSLIPDDPATIAQTIQSQCKKHQPDILLAAGGTGPGPRDCTPEVLESVCDRMLTGLGDFLRSQSLYYTDTAWLSRMTAGMLGRTLVVAFPGSPKAVRECWEMIAPFIGDAIEKIEKQGHAKPKNGKRK